MTGTHMYHPEMGEKRDPSKLFDTSFNFRDTYSLSWDETRDDEARAKLKALRIRIGGRYAINRYKAGQYTTLITSRSHDKLMADGCINYEMLLD